MQSSATAARVQGVEMPTPDAELRASYIGRVLRDVEHNVLEHPDYDPQRFENTHRLLQMLAAERGRNVVVDEAKSEDMYD